MAAELSPAFQFYVKEWRSSRAIMRMSFAERGIYLEMLLEQWENLSVPTTPEACAQLIGGTVYEWRKAWPVVSRKFVTQDNGLVNLRLEQERAKQRRGSRRQSDKGKAGAAARWHKQETEMPVPSSGDSTGISEHGFAFPIATAIAFPIATASANVPPRAGKEPPMQLHLRRLKVWRYMIDRWTERLGDHVDAFDLHGWLSDVDGSVGGVVLPSTGQEWWTFLDAKFSEEVRRRALPMAADDTPRAPQMGKLTTRLAAAMANIRAEENLQ